MPEQTTPPATSTETGEGTTSTSTDAPGTAATAAERPVRSFTDCGVDPALAEALAAKGIHSPFPIQEVTLPIATRGHDVIGQARTGTGKTLAFGLALLGRVTPGGGTQALVIVPTRELCIQVAEELQIGRARGLRIIAVYGGVGYEEQEEAFREGHEVVVGTPGRLLDHLNKRNLRLDGVTELVLDEADEMLDMGFLPDVERLIEACNDDRHGMLFSATMPTDVVKLARRYLDHPTFMRADHEVVQTAPNVEQHFFQVHRMDKPRVLARILQSPERGGVYVFVRTKHMADRLVRELEDLATPAIAIHGDLRQATREKNLDKFRDGSATVLVATEVAARGLDVENVTHVINYDCPDDEKMYLHRIGRTARAGGKGVAVTFAEFNEIDRLNVVRKKLGQGENAIAAVFSTSDELAERFDLPADRPWDAHVAATKAGTRTDRRAKDGDDRGGDRGGRGRSGGDRGGRGGDRGGRGGDREKRGGDGEKRGGDREKRGGDRESRDQARGGRSEDAATRQDADAPARAGDGGGRANGSEERPAARRRGTSDGRPKSKRSTEGRGNDRDASRPRPDRDAEPSTGRGSDQETSESGDPRSGGRDEERGTRTRTRTRTRSRGEDRPTDTADAPKDPAADDRGAEERTSDRGSSTSGRTRARARGGASPRGGERQGSTSEDSTSEGRTRGGRTRESRDRGGDGRADGNARADGDDRGRSGDQPRSGGRNDNRGGRGGRDGGRNRGGDRNRGNDRGNRGNDRGSRGDNGRGGRDDRGGRDLDPTVTTARRGEEARGEGDPQLARRVRVEHLP
jgi:superfamily II DNA/RNA helicase